MIELKQVSKRFETEDIYTHAVQEVDLSVSSGDFLSIQGTSGSGKSTLLHMLGLLEAPSSGTYVFSGKDVTRLTPAQRASVRARQIGFIFQSFNLLGDLTVLDNVMLPMEFSNLGLDREIREARALSTLERVGLQARAKHRPHQLSGGQQQRVAIARALVNEPIMLLADEPTGNLDSETGKGVMALVRDLNASGMTVVMVTHDPKHAVHASRHVVMKDGRIVSDSAPV